MLKEEVRNLLVDKIVRKLNPSFILLFGSHAKGTAHSRSDVDIAYLSSKELSAYERFIVASELAERVGCEVDLIDIRLIDTCLQCRFLCKVFLFILRMKMNLCVRKCGLTVCMLC